MVLDASGISGMDASGMNMFRAMLEEHRRRTPPVRLLLAGQKGPLRSSLRKSGAKRFAETFQLRLYRYTSLVVTALVALLVSISFEISEPSQDSNDGQSVLLQSIQA